MKGFAKKEKIIETSETLMEHAVERATKLSQCEKGGFKLVSRAL